MVRSSLIKNRQGHPINKKTYCGDCIGPKMFRDIQLEQKGQSSLKKMSIISQLPYSERVYQHTRPDGESYVVT